MKENANNRHPDKTPKPPQFEEVIFTKEEIQKEKWKKYKNLEVSSLGRVKGQNQQILTGSKDMSGYMKYAGTLGQVLVWEAFNGYKPENTVINHINGNKWG